MAEFKKSIIVILVTVCSLVQVASAQYGQAGGRYNAGYGGYQDYGGYGSIGLYGIPPLHPSSLSYGTQYQPYSGYTYSSFGGPIQQVQQVSQFRPGIYHDNFNACLNDCVNSGQYTLTECQQWCGTNIIR